MSKQRDELRTMANQAKKRLKSGYWELLRDKHNESITASDSNTNVEKVKDFYKKKIDRDSKSQVDAEEESLYLRVREMLVTGEIIINPISRLIDNEKFDNMDSDSRQRYIFQLSEKYRSMCERYRNELKSQTLAN